MGTFSAKSLFFSKPAERSSTFWARPFSPRAYLSLCGNKAGKNSNSAEQIRRPPHSISAGSDARTKHKRQTEPKSHRDSWYPPCSNKVGLFHTVQWLWPQWRTYDARLARTTEVSKTSNGWTGMS